MTEHKKAEWRGVAHKLPDGSYIDKYGDVCYAKNGKRHREGGPAVEYANGGKYWFIDGKYHREDGPAIERANGDKEWWINGERYREDGPAVEYACGSKDWYISGRRYGTKKAYEEALKVWKMNEAMK